MPSSDRLPFRSRLRAAVSRRVASWSRARQGEDRLPLTLESRRIYILPTRTGVATAVLLLLTLLTGLNYNNSLVLLLCFTLTGLALVSMYECHRTLAGLVVQRAQIDPTFAGTPGSIYLSFSNTDRRDRQCLALCCPGQNATRFALPAGESGQQPLSYDAPTRGRLSIERVELSSDAPLGLFRAWTWLHLPLETIVYPTPLGNRRLPPPTADRRSALEPDRSHGEDEWAALRPYRMGDSPRRVAWKAYARGAPLLVAEYDAPAGLDRTLDFTSLADLPLEARLSQLARWVLECERRGESFELRLPDARASERARLRQRRGCLEALALYDL